MPAFIRSRLFNSPDTNNAVAMPGCETKYQEFEDVITREQRILVVGCHPHDSVTVIREGSADALEDDTIDFSKLELVKRLLHQGRYERILGHRGAEIGIFTVNHAAVIAPSRYEPAQGRYDWPELIECGRENILPLR